MVNLLDVCKEVELKVYLNTSYVMVNQYEPYDVSFINLDLNTSYVMVNRIFEGMPTIIDKFKYILCYG